MQVENLTKSVDRTNDPGNDVLIILQNISFVIQPGEKIAIVGPSGSGKSTLLGLLAGLDIPTSGKVIMDGTDIFVSNEDARARLRGEKLGFVFQSFQLLPTLTALENVMLPMEINGRGEAKMVATTVLERVGLKQRLGHYPSQLSGGEQQRVAIARAFAPRPKILLADEPTGNLDQRTGQRVVDLLFELNQEQGTTLVLVTHNRDLARRCDRVLQLNDGQLVTS